MSTSHAGTTHDNDAARFLRTAAMAVGAVFLLVGILGFIPGITENAPGDFAGHKSDAKLLGIFEVSILHNLVHVLFGIIGLAVAKNAKAAGQYLLYGGIIYLVLFVYGLVIDHDSAANFVPLNGADNVLHLLLGIGMTALGALGLKKLKDHHGGIGAGAPR